MERRIYMKGRSKVLLVATLLATAYSIYLISHFFGGVAEADGAEAVGGMLATALVMPHIIMFALGAVFGWLGWFLKAPWGALVGGILYAVGTVMFVMYAMFGVPIMVLGFVGFSKQKKLNKNKDKQEKEIVA